MKLLPLSCLFLSVSTAAAFSPATKRATFCRSETTKLHASTSSDRRDFLEAAAVGLIATSTSTPFEARAADSGGVDYKQVSRDIAKLVKKNPDWGPTLVRLAWHSSGTFDPSGSIKGGSSKGTIRFKQEQDHEANAGLGQTAVQWLEPIHKRYAKDGLSYADLYTLAGVTAIREMGGPTIPWSSGRVDAPDPSSVPPEGRLPNADTEPPKGADPSDAEHLRTIFNRMGFNDQEIVALSGAHALGRCHEKFSGYEGPWTPQPTKFSNLYFVILSNVEWVPKDWSGKFQYVDAPSGLLMMLPTDLVLLKDSSFDKWVTIYAQDSDRFNRDFSKAFQKLEELGTTGLVLTDWEPSYKEEKPVLFTFLSDFFEGIRNGLGFLRTRKEETSN